MMYLYLKGGFSQKIPQRRTNFQYEIIHWERNGCEAFPASCYLLHSFGKHFPISKKYLFFHPHDHFVGLNDSALIFSPAIGPPKKKLG